jgi:unsaturated rhamnogalacturonyl hydrolase
MLKRAAHFIFALIFISCGGGSRQGAYTPPPPPPPEAEPVQEPPPAPTPQPPTGWAELESILARIQPPKFPDRQCTITDHGAVAGGKQDATQAIADAIAKCSAEGGGRVLVPPGVFLTGAIHLKSNIELHVSDGATLQFSTDPKSYLPLVLTRWEGIECMNYSPLIYAIDVENVAVTGKGTLDGAASKENWWKWAKKGPNKLSMASPAAKHMNEMSEKGVPVAERTFGEGSYLRPNFVQFYRSRNILVEDVTLLRSPMWEIHPVLSENVTVRGIKIVSHGPNNDGCNPDSSTDVLIENALFDVGDDCIAIKSGRNDDGRRVGKRVENIIVRNSVMKDGHAGVAIGSEIAAGANNIFIENNKMDSPNLERALRLKSNARRGGVIENIYMRNIQVGEVSEAMLTIDFLYEEGDKGKFPPTARNIQIENVTTHKAPRLFFIQSFKGATIDNISVKDSVFSNVTATEVLSHVGAISLHNVTVTPEKAVRSQSSRTGPQ